MTTLLSNREMMFKSKNVLENQAGKEALQTQINMYFRVWFCVQGYRCSLHLWVITDQFHICSLTRLHKEFMCITYLLGVFTA